MGFSRKPGKPMAEHQFLQTFLTVGASMVLVGGSLILLTSTSPFTPPPQMATEPSMPASTRVATARDQTRMGMTNEVPVERSFTASTGKEPDTVAHEEAIAPEVPAVEDDSVAVLGTPIAPEIDQGDEEETPEGMAVADGAPQPDDATSQDTAGEADFAAASEPDASMDEDKVGPAPSEPDSFAEDKTNAASDQIGEMLAGLRPRVIATDVSSAATSEVADVLAATPPTPAETIVEAPKLAIAPPPPLPARKPEEAPPAPKEVAVSAPPPHDVLAKPEERSTPPQQVAQEAPEPPTRSRWHPMALAPANEGAIVRVPTARPTGAAYASKVWSALARHKPRAGQRGSALVMFAIGPNGALRGLKVGRSSGNARIDQLALATVRSAAPFPPPPSDSASYSIRIDFH
jgi:protein TonB